MPAIREHDLPPPCFDDDDGMPPLVDNPNPSMTFTFFTDMTPITALSADPTIPFETVWENPVSTPASTPVDLVELPESQAASFQGPDRASHGKKRDASYIPRPPNAFILFRSSFIRSQQVPEKVEGNHSTLSKIIGKYWKTLSREEREVWEAKALVAQAEHRKRYPDWRFRPGANAFAKLKVKDGPQASNRKRTGQTTRKLKGDPTCKKAKSCDERCAIITDLLVEGKTGVDLEDAVRQWEVNAGRGGGACRKMGTRAGNESGDEEREVAMVASEVDAHGNAVVSTPGAEAPITPTSSPGFGGCVLPQSRAQTPNASLDDRFRIPLTAMFKRSLSAPAAQPSPSDMSPHDGHESLDSVFVNVSYDIAESPQGVCAPPSFNGDQSEDLAHAVSPDSIGCLSPLVLPSILREGVSARWNDPYNLLETSIGVPPSPECPGLTYALHTPPAMSPVESHAFAAAAVYNNSVCSANAATVATATTTPFGTAVAYAREMQPNAYDPASAAVPKSWAECTMLLHEQQMPIFVNAYAGGMAGDVYDWCTPAYGVSVVDGSGNGDGADASMYSYPYAPGVHHNVFGGFADDYMRVHAGDCMPAVAY